MKTDRTWQGVRLRQIDAAVDPDSPTRPVRLPASWDDAAAAAVCELAPGTGRVSLPALAQSWILPLSARAKEAGVAGLADRLHTLLLLRQGAPTEGVWRGSPGDTPGFVLNLPAFHDTAAGFDVEAFGDAVATAAEALHLLAPHATQYAVSMADLAGLLAALGLEYSSKPARDVAACLAGLLRGRVDAVLAGPQPDLLAAIPSWPAAPSQCVVPGLAVAAATARAAALRSGSVRPGTAILAPSATDALLGVETGGIAPAFAPVGPNGLLRATRAWMTARGISQDAALAAALAGEPVVPIAAVSDHAAMHDAVAPLLNTMPARPTASPSPANDTKREELPSRRRGYTQKAAIGGHRVFLRTGEYADGRLGEIGLALPRESAAVRGLADAFAAALSVGLQHGTPLDAYVDALAHARFAPAGAVEGDAAIDRASSIPDYVARSLAASYLGRVVPADGAALPPEPEETPLLPLDLPRRRARVALRLVAG
ncbi:TSCPD domain-containing protein [Acidisphaera sp. L21]|uniref:TSCPD domain-containing protein n=1 Tax=Acidisphaera sp. L21 TaxID=1641851 RepID=UPI00131B9944|nr:TSCPD domain-containing protein [Acidisphaera sp. L21]